MKLKSMLFIFLIMLFMQAGKANIFKIDVSNFQFSPASVTANVGDTIQWVYVNGFHTTSSLSIPDGATVWDAPMNKTGDTFQYILKISGEYHYQCNIHAPEMNGTITVNSILPVNLNSFSISSKIAGIAIINWSTASETNTDYFIVKKSINGTVFTEISRIKATGNSTSIHNYSVTDNNVGTFYKYVYYMIDAVDKDGSSTLSSINKFVNNSALKKLVTQLSPNPLTRPGHLMFQFNADKEGEMLVQLYDNSGKLIADEKAYGTPGLNNGHFHLGNLAPGIYTIVFSLGQIKESYKIIMQ
ncbi:MAG: T9SS type A sorting domain-containing protein [Parafilimonas sp.]